MSSPTDRPIHRRTDRMHADPAISSPEPAVTRRRFLRGTGVAALAASGGGGFLQLLEAKAQGLSLPAALSEGTRASAVLDALPGKKPLIKLSYRPPNYETPIEYFRTAITPNDAFFVRYHLSNIPEVDAKTWKVAVGGEGANGQAEFTLDELKEMPAVEIVAVNQCSGNRRGLFQPHVAGVEWGYGAMGCARWKGVRLKDVLDKVGLKKEAIEIVSTAPTGRQRQDARLHQEHSGVEGDGGHDADRLRDERAAAAAFQRISCASHRAGLDRHLLDEARHLDQGGDQAGKRLLDEPGLSHPAGQVPARSRASRRRTRRSTRRSPKWW